jgi:glucose/arabinose dehydrogenase
MFKHTFLALVASLALSQAHAQTNSASAPATPAAASPAKKELVQKVLKLQQAGVESVATQLAEAPAMQLMQQAGAALQRLPADKREAVARDIQADVRKYADETVPPLRERAVKLAPSVLGPMLEERFSEDELKQLVAWMENPLSRKYAAMGSEMQRALAEKLAADARPSVEPKLQALQASLAKRLGITQPGAPASGPAPAKKK